MVGDPRRCLWSVGRTVADKHHLQSSIHEGERNYWSRFDDPNTVGGIGEGHSGWFDHSMGDLFLSFLSFCQLGKQFCQRQVFDKECVCLGFHILTESGALQDESKESHSDDMSVISFVLNLCLRFMKP